MKKLLGEERREQLLHLLKQSEEPLKGTDLAQITGVSRQVIVNDMTLLKARNEPIIATSQGYLYFQAPIEMEEVSRQIACKHSPDDTRDELYTLVDAGATVRNVTVEHPVYGELTANLMVANRYDADKFMERVQDTGASYLLELTEGVHLHLISASSEEIIEQAIAAMKVKGYLVDELM